MRRVAEPGMLYLVPTPIGNLGDITLRALEVLREADLVACEDSRRTGQLLKQYEIAGKRLMRFFEHNEEKALPRLLEALRAGQTVALVTDGGMPGLSDPGFRAVRAVREAELPLTVLPGPSAAPAALVASGLPVASFTFLGFPPRKAGKLRAVFEAEAEARHTLVLYESPHRLAKCLAAAREVLGERRAAVCRELSKLHEEVRRGTLGELQALYESAKPKGEITLVIEGDVS